MPRLPLGFTAHGLILLVAIVAPAAEFKLEQVVNGTAAGEASGGAFRVTETGGQSVVGTSRSEHWRIDYGFWDMMGSPPVATALAFSVQSGQTLDISFNSIIAQVHDPDADRVWVSSVVPVSVRGGTVEFSGVALTYTPPPGVAGPDHFTYQLMDSGGDGAFGTITVTIGTAEPEPPRVVHGPTVTNGEILVRYAGVPGLTYTIETSERLETGAWRKLFNITAPQDGGALGAGVFEVRDLVKTTSSGFFRVVWPAY